jgi:hypothetical protein
LTVEVENVGNAQGAVGVLVFNTARGWLEKFSAARRAEARAAHTGVVEITIPDLPAGDYAVVALHDEHANKQLDRLAQSPRQSHHAHVQASDGWHPGLWRRRPPGLNGLHELDCNLTGSGPPV